MACSGAARLRALDDGAVDDPVVGCRGHVEGDPARISGGGDRVRPGRRTGSLLGDGRADAVRDAADLRLPRATLEARAAHCGGASGDHRQRQDVHGPHPEGHPFHRRPRVQGEEARAHRGGLRVFAEAIDRPEGALALGVARGRQDRRTRCPCRGREEVRQVRLRREDRGAHDAGPLHAAHPAQRHRLQPLVHPGPRADLRGCARSNRRVSRRGRTGDVQSGGHRRLHAEAMDPQLENRPRGEPRLPGLHVGLHLRRPRRSAADRPNEGQEDAPGRARRDQHHGGGPGAAPRVPERRTGLDGPRGPARAERPRRRQAEARSS